MQIFIPLRSSIEINKTSADTYARKYEYITYQVFIPNIPSLYAKMYISTLFFLFEINNPSANTYALKYEYITYQVCIPNIPSISIKTEKINFLL